MNLLVRPHRNLIELLAPLIDVLGVVGAAWLAHAFVGRPLDDRSLLLAFLAAFLFELLGRVANPDQRWCAPDPDRELLAVALAWGLTVLAIGGLVALAGLVSGGLEPVEVFWFALTPVVVGLGRMALRIARRSARRLGLGATRVAIAGFNHLGAVVARGLQAGIDCQEFQLVGFYDDRGTSRTPSPETAGLSCRGTFADLLVAVRRGQVDMVLVTLPMRAEERIRWLLDQLSDTTSSVYIVPDIFVFELLHSKWRTVSGLPAVSVHESPFYGVDGALKRAVDVVLAASLLVLLALPMALIALLVRATSPGPALFRQRRYGLDGREIRVRKFRTMRVCEDGPEVRQATAADDRITPLGRFLRRTSLDELPQLLNVLEGSMSLVGPRPHAAAHNEHYRKLIRGYMLRHKVRPGITGLAQVEGCRGETETVDKMRRRIEFDHLYIREWSLRLDAWILLRTLWVGWRQPQAH